MDNIKAKYIERLKVLHFQKTGEMLTDQRALEIFEKLIALVKAVYRPIPINAFSKSHQNYEV